MGKKHNAQMQRDFRYLRYEQEAARTRLLNRGKVYDILNATSYFTGHPLAVMQQIKATLKKATVINIQNVWHYMMDSTADFKLGDFKLIAPPMPSMFFEFTDYFENSTDGMRVGILITAIPGDEVVGHYFKATHFGYWNDTLKMMDYQLTFASDVNGNYMTDYLRYESTFNEYSQFEERRIGTYHYMALMAISLLNCKNVEVIEQVPDTKVSNSFNQSFGVPMVKYRVLKVSTSPRKERALGGSNQKLSPTSLHIVRGNFATYTNERPLFGKYVGTFWRPAHIRGDEQRGVVVKDYEVSPDNDMTGVA